MKNTKGGAVDGGYARASKAAADADADAMQCGVSIEPNQNRRMQQDEQPSTPQYKLCGCIVTMVPTVS
jgi:hypothetical protein